MDNAIAPATTCDPLSASGTSFNSGRAPLPESTTFVILTVAFFASGFGIGVAIVLVVTVRQTVTSDRMMGRMNASYRFVVWGNLAVGAMLGGFLGSTLGLRATLVVGAVGIATAPAWIVLSPIGRLRRAAEASTRLDDVVDAVGLRATGPGGVVLEDLQAGATVDVGKPVPGRRIVAEVGADEFDPGGDAAAMMDVIRSPRLSG